MAKEYGVCPVCDGSKRAKADPNMSAQAKKWMGGYDAATDTMPCGNCGSQYMYGSPSGKVPLTSAGVPCTHKYVGRNAGRCLTRYTCSECGDTFDIDSSD